MHANFAILLLCFAFVCVNVVTNGKRDADCSLPKSKQNPDVRDRFTDEQLQWICDRSDDWTKAVRRMGRLRSGFGGTAPPTNKQLEWLSAVRGCLGSACLSDVVKCTDKSCLDTSLQGAQRVASPMRTRSGAALRPRFMPFPEYTVQAEDILKLNVDQLDLKLLLDNNTDDIEACEKRMFISDTCFMVSKSNNASEAFKDQIKASALQKNKLISDLQNQFTKLVAKCNEANQVLKNASKTFEDVKPCSDFTKPKSWDKTTMVEKCPKILEAETPCDAFPEFKNKVKTVYAQNMLAAGYGRWLERCRVARDTFEDVEMSFKLNIWSTGHRQARETSVLLFDDSKPDLRAYRKDIRMMTDNERKRYFAAINQLKNDKIDGLSKYDLFATYHSAEDSPGAHFGPAFLPFHREFLKQYEIALRQVDSTLSLPYWDSTLDEGLPKAEDSILWTPEFFGNGNGTVTDGPFANWNTTVKVLLNRRVSCGGWGDDCLITEKDIKYVLNLTTYDDLEYCFNEYFESFHGIVHGFVGGLMGRIPSAANDPVFYMHHCFIDFIWEEFRQNRQKFLERETNYTEDRMVCENFHKGNELMRPFRIKNREGLSNNYTKELFFYQQRPSCSSNSPTCGSPYLYCDIKKYRCLSKIRPNGNCRGFDDTDICYGSKCVNGTCEVA